MNPSTTYKTLDESNGTERRRRSGESAEKRVMALVNDSIQAHRLNPGDRLIERELSEGANASRQAVRNALVRLAEAGLVILTPNCGATVMQSSPETTRQIMWARIVNEGAALHALAEHLDEEGAARLQDILRQEASCYDEGQINEARQFSRMFHLTFTELAGNTMITRFVRELIACQPLLGAHAPNRKSGFSGVPAHTKTLAALLQGDGLQAEALNTELLCALEREFLHEIAEDQN